MMAVFISIARIGILNVISAIFINGAMKNGELDKKHITKMKVRMFLEDADDDGDGIITWDEFARHLGTPSCCSSWLRMS